jgi:PAS domain S-box-containing protein
MWGMAGGAQRAYRSTLVGANPMTTHELPSRRDPTRNDLLLLIDSVTDYAIFVLDPAGRVTTWSEGARRIKGYDAHEIIGQHFSRFYPPEDVRAGRPEAVLEIARREGRYQEEGWRVRKDGSRFWAMVTVTALFGPGGELRGFGKVTRDLTERRSAEETARELIRQQAARAAAQEAEVRVRESEERFRAISARLEVILQNVADGITVMDEHGRIVYANDAAARLFGLGGAPELLALGTAIIERYDLLDEDGEPIPLDRTPARAVLRGEQTEPMLLRLRDRATHDERWCLLRASPVLDAAGKPELAVTIVRDVTAESRQREAARFLAEATAAMTESLDYETTLARVASLLVPRVADWCVVDVVENGRLVNLAVTHADPEKSAIAREDRQKNPPPLDEPRGIGEVLRTGRAALYPDVTDAMLVEGARDAAHLALLRRVGMRSVLIAPLRTHGKPFGALTLVSSQPGRRYDEQDLAFAEELARRAGFAIENARAYRDARAAIKIRDEFLSIAGHELKTPLAALKLQLESLENALAASPWASELARPRERLHKTLGHTARLERLISELLDVSRLHSGRLELHPEEMDLGALVEEVVERHGDDARRHGSAISLFRSGDLRGFWDRGRLDQVVTNLLGNAVKYGRGAPIEVSVRGEGGRVKLSVRDRGIGIASEDQARIFGRFERAVSERHYGGFGLGLWIVRQLIEAHGGTVSFTSEADQGSTFVVELPARRDG